MKKILLVCKEAYTNPMNFVKDELVSLGYEVEALFIHSSEVLLEDDTYKNFIERNDDIKVHSIQDVCRDFINGRNNLDELIDYDYLETIEKKYCDEIPLNLLQISSQLFTTQSHYRFYFRHMKENEKLYYIQLLFKFFEEFLDKNKFFKICDLDIAEIGRSVLHQVSQVLQIPYVSLEFSRYNNIILPTYTLGRKTDKYFIDFCNKNKRSVEQKYIQEVKDFRNKKAIINEDYKYNNTGKVEGSTLVQDILRLAHGMIYIFKTIPGWIKYSRTPLIANPFKAFGFFFLWFLRERLIFNKFFSLFKKPGKDERYVYFPLHLIPESTTLNKSPFYTNELAVIEAISKSLPVGVKLYVKEHGAMVGERPFSFYKTIKKFTNVKLVQMNHFSDPKAWITNSLGVATLSGTAAFEAAMLNIPAIMLGSTFFEEIDGISKIDSFQNIPSIIGKFSDLKQDNIDSVATYLKAIDHFGEKVHMVWLLQRSAYLISENLEPCQKVKLEISNLIKIFGLSS